MGRWPLVLGLGLGLLAIVAGLQAGADPAEGWRLAARWTARVGFPLLIVTYSASSLARLLPGPLTRDLLRNRRWWGLGFAASHSLHLVALVNALRLSQTPPNPVSLVGGGIGYLLIYAMAATSNRPAMRALGPNWKRLHMLGIHWLWFVFAFSYFGRILRPGAMAEGTIGFTIALAAAGLRFSAARLPRQRAVQP